MDWKNGEGEIVVMKLTRLPLSAFVGVVPPKGLDSLFHRANCYWLINVDRFFFFFYFFPHGASVCPRYSMVQEGCAIHYVYYVVRLHLLIRSCD